MRLTIPIKLTLALCFRAIPERQIPMKNINLAIPIRPDNTLPQQLPEEVHQETNRL